ncbi:transcription factor BIM2-like isoform X2 [Phragmites australis]|uniref:transcription factor BIM2-like isoform X2 n=1 Tax=Phragmites australis TaxID=29695 RepID=UPI002D764F08|nr:transcription factor BIM2-like isoform X2 [Phragmites australis]
MFQKKRKYRRHSQTGQAGLPPIFLPLALLPDYNKLSGVDSRIRHIPSVLEGSKIQTPSFCCSGSLGRRQRSLGSRVRMPMQLFQGEKPAHDFLSLHTGGGSSSPVQLQDTQHSTQVVAYDLGVHNSLKPLKLAKQRGGGDGAIGMASSGLEVDLEEHVLPGGVETFSISQVPSAQSRGEVASHGIARGAFAPVLHGSRTEGTHGTESGTRAHSGPSTMWQDSGIDQRSRARGEGRSSGSSADQRPGTPRSKHSATEQRRRTKINDRLELLRELLPHGDQKRDKASFLLEVIEYIRFLQEKVQKFESANPQKNHEDSFMPWAKVYYRSCWRNTEGGRLSPSTQGMNKEQYGSKQITEVPTALFSTQSARETITTNSTPQKVATTAQNCANISAPTRKPPWLSMSTPDSGNETLIENKRQCLHEDTRSISNAYSQGILTRLTEALKTSGVDPSQANISVEINMGRRETVHSDIHGDSKVNEGEDSTHVAKRLLCERS